MDSTEVTQYTTQRAELTQYETPVFFVWRGLSVQAFHRSWKDTRELSTSTKANLLGKFWPATPVILYEYLVSLVWGGWYIVLISVV